MQMEQSLHRKSFQGFHVQEEQLQVQRPSHTKPKLKQKDRGRLQRSLGEVAVLNCSLSVAVWFQTTALLGPDNRLMCGALH